MPTQLSTQDVRRRLIWHGIFLFFLGLLTGFLVNRAFTNPRMGLSAHLEGVMNGTFLAVLGAVWGELRLPARAATAAFWLALYGHLCQLGLNPVGSRLWYESRYTDSWSRLRRCSMAGESRDLRFPISRSCHNAVLYLSALGTAWTRSRTAMKASPCSCG